MFKQLVLLLAVSATLVAAEKKLYISDDMYMIDYVGHYNLISSDKILEDGHRYIVNQTTLLSMQDNDCSWHMILTEDFVKKSPELLDEFEKDMKLAMSKDSKKLIAVTINVTDIRVDRLVGYPQPKDVEANEYKIKVLDKGHCFVTNPNFNKYLPAIIINKNSIARVDRDGSILYEARDCVAPDVKKLLDEVKQIAEDC